HPSTTGFVGIAAETRHFKKDHAMMNLIVARECGRREGRSGRHGRAVVDAHAQHFAVPVNRGVEVGRSQRVVLQLRMDDDLGVHLARSFSRLPLVRWLTNYVRRLTMSIPFYA